MDTTVVIIVIAVIVALAIAAAAWIYLRKRRSEALRSRFGPEYDRLVEQENDRRRAEAILEQREKRIERLNIRPLTAEEREQYAQAWLQEQALFVDHPQEAVANADRLVTEVMKVRGYPMGDFEQRAEDISVNYPAVVEHYRIAHAIALRDMRGEANTEDLRKAMLHYRMLFEELLEHYYIAEPQEVRR
ncbi:MAG TPA: hypothetical protein VNN73_00690 [Blastocatellia bacterium]|nr:hypothetical protein [Blastocatellia bacterium]